MARDGSSVVCGLFLIEIRSILGELGNRMDRSLFAGDVPVYNTRSQSSKHDISKEKKKKHRRAKDHAK